VDSGDAAVLALLDQSAAFDTIDHSILLSRLTCRFGITGSVLTWFRSYLYDRCQSVSISGVNSAAVYLSFGVPQGSVLGPVLFTLYNSPIHSISLKHGVTDHYYADDDQKYSFHIIHSTLPLTTPSSVGLSPHSLPALVKQSSGWQKIG
jgi:hypothetical protein